jgi:hypothetical protein
MLKLEDSLVQPDGQQGVLRDRAPHGPQSGGSGLGVDFSAKVTYKGSFYVLSSLTASGFLKHLTKAPSSTRFPNSQILT